MKFSSLDGMRRSRGSCVSYVIAMPSLFSGEEAPLISYQNPISNDFVHYAWNVHNIFHVLIFSDACLCSPLVRSPWGSEVRAPVRETFHTFQR